MTAPLFIPSGEAPPAVPPDWQPFVRCDGDAVVVTGDPVGAVPVYLWRTPEGLWLSRDPARFPAELARRGETPRISSEAVSLALGYCIVPAPVTIHDGLTVAGIGDVFRVPRAPAAAVTHRVDFPYLRARSRQDSIPDPAVLKELLTRSVARTLASGGEPLLMLSSGKDSTSLLLALAEVAPDRACAVTYAQRAEGDEESEVARAMCRRFGVRHRVVTFDLPPDRFREAMTRVFAAAPEPSLDFTLFPYVAAVAAAGTAGGLLLDGTGNDVYSGFVPRPADRLVDHIPASVPHLAPWLQPLLPSESRLNHLLFTRAENSLFGPKLRPADHRGFFPADPSALRRLAGISREGRDLDGVDFRTMMVRLFDGNRVMQKARSIAPAFAMTAAHPLADAALADYCFHLPEAWRFTERPRRNKILWRAMLARFADYDADRIGKRIFEFDARAPLRSNRDFVFEEILSCPLWRRAGAEAFLRRGFDDLDRRAHAQHHVMRLFLLSGWLNRHLPADTNMVIHRMD